MRKWILAAAIPLAACSFHSDSDAEAAGAPASGSGSTRNFAVSGFSAIDLKGSDDVDVRVGTGFSIRAEGPSADLDKLRIAREGDTLAIGRKSHSGISWSHGNKVKVFVTLPRLASASVSGSGDMSVDRVEGSHFTGDVAGSGSLGIAALQVDEAAMTIAGSGDLHAAGTARKLKVDVAGSGTLDAARLTAQSAAVSVAGSGDVRASVEGNATVNVVGSGDVDLGAKARCQTSKMGSGDVRCGG